MRFSLKQAVFIKSEANPNIIAVSLNTCADNIANLKETVIDGPPYLCNKCRGALNMHSQYTPLQTRADGKIKLLSVQNESNGNWICEFCKETNPMDRKIEKPQQEIIYYKNVKPDTSLANYSIEKIQLVKDPVVMFLLDISGSMKDKIKSLQEAIKFEVNALRSSVDSKRIKIGLMTFDSDVFLHTPNNQLKFTCDFNDKTTLIKEGEKYADKPEIFFSLEKDWKIFMDKVDSLVPNNSTAFGPAIYIAVSILKNNGIGHALNVITDGLSNVGIGNVEKYGEKSLPAYEFIANYAKDSGIVINAIGFEGNNCAMKVYEALADETAGDLRLLKAQDFENNKKNLRELISTKLIGMDATIEFRVPWFLKIDVDEENKELDISFEQTILKKKLGNMNSQEEIRFRFLAKDVSGKPADLSKHDSIVVQLKIHYLSASGYRVARIETKKLTFAKTESEIKMALKDLDNKFISAEYTSMITKLRDSGDEKAAAALEKKVKKLAEQVDELNKNGNCSGIVSGMLINPILKTEDERTVRNYQNKRKIKSM